MITEYLPGAEGLTGHWAVVVVVGLAFLLVQIVLSLRLLVRARSQDRMLSRLTRDLEFGGDGRRELDDLPRRFSWLDWVLSVFPTEDSLPPGNFTRDEVLHELDTRIASDSSYLLLQRMGIMAPLLGVVLTVVGFYWLKVDETGEQSLQTILVAVTPLVSGVGAGAVLALVNQVLLQGVGGRMERLRMSARTWFDAAIWRHVGAEGRGAAVTAVADIERFAGAVVETASRHAASADRIEAATASMKLAASQFENVVRAFHGEIKGIPQALCVLRDATAASAQALQDILPVGARAVANLDVSVAAFRTTIDREFTDAAKLHFHASQSLARSLEQIGDSTELLKSGADAMTDAASANAAASKKAEESLVGAANGLAGVSERLRRSIESDMAPSQQTMHGAANSFAESAARLSEFIGQGLHPATRELAALHETLAGLEGTIDALRKFSLARADVDRLTETLSRAAAIADAISSLPEQIRGILEQSVAQSANLAAARSLKTWLGGRPR